MDPLVRWCDRGGEVILRPMSIKYRMYAMPILKLISNYRWRILYAISGKKHSVKPEICGNLGVRSRFLRKGVILKKAFSANC